MEKYNESNIHWSENINILFNGDNICYFIPNKNYSVIKNLNRIQRLITLYYSFIVLLFNNGDINTHIIYFILLSVLNYIIYRQYSIETFNSNLNSSKLRMSTKNNPMMNLSILDYNNGDVGCANKNDTNIKKNIMDGTYKNINANNIDKLNSQGLLERNFYTMPNTCVPNNQVEFAKSLYDKGPTCKQDTSQCIKTIPDRW